MGIFEVIFGRFVEDKKRIAMLKEKIGEQEKALSALTFQVGDSDENCRNLDFL